MIAFLLIFLCWIDVFVLCFVIRAADESLYSKKYFTIPHQTIELGKIYKRL